jgi:hypothetical protein
VAESATDAVTVAEAESESGAQGFVRHKLVRDFLVTTWKND